MLVNFKSMGVPIKGMNKDGIDMELSQGSTIEDLINLLSEDLDDGSLKLLNSANFLLNGISVDLYKELEDGDKLIIKIGRASCRERV